MASSVTLGVGVLLMVLAILCLGLSFSTDYWALWNVDRSAIKKHAAEDPNSVVAKNIDTQGIYFTRYFGLWRTCYPGNETNTFLSTAQGVTDNYCLVVNYELGEYSTTATRTSDYWVMINLRRCTFAFMVAAIVMGLLACVAGTWGCWKATPTPNSVAGGLALSAALFGGGSIGCFHGVHYMEENVLTDAGFVKSWPTYVLNHTFFNLQWSYMVGWAGVALCLLTAVLFLVEAYNIRVANRRKKLRKSSKRLRDYYSDIDRKSISGHVSNPVVPPPVPLQARQMSQKAPPPTFVGNGVSGGPDDDRLVPVLVYDNFGQDGDLQYMPPSNYQKYT